MSTEYPIAVTSFYKFFTMTDAQVSELEAEMESLAKKMDAKGLLILGREGVNSTMSVPNEKLEDLQKAIEKLTNQELTFKNSGSPKHPFKAFRTKVRDEIVTIARTDLVPMGKKRHLTPEEWSKALKEDVVVIDTRNDYEYEIGHFKGAINPDTNEFTEFPEYIKRADIPKDKKVLIYCTGGIRCEKAILSMEEMGYENVYQLQDGILNYLKEKPNEDFEGECFVFDYRVAVNQNLEPSDIYRLCPHCGQPGKTPIECVHCGDTSINCDKCLEADAKNKTCSKNCAHHFSMGHRFKQAHKDSKKLYVKSQI